MASMACPQPSTHEENPRESSAAAIRRLLLIILWLGLTGAVADLLLIDHLESWTQWIPLVVLSLAASTLLWSGLGGGAAALRAVQLAMVSLLLAGGLGVFLHLRGSAAFQTEIDPAINGAVLLWKTLRAKAPPALAPAAMVQLGLIGLVYCYRHPNLRSTSKPIANSGEA
jgi:hypothetical protein